MQINRADSNNCQNTTNFKAMRYCPGYMYNEAQKSVFEGLKSALNVPVSQKNKMNLVDVLEKNGLDVYVSPAKNDSLQLFLANRVEDSADFKMQDFDYFKNVGQYSTKESLTNKTIEELMSFASKEDEHRKKALKGGILFFAASVIAIAGAIATALHLKNTDSVDKNVVNKEVVTDNTTPIQPDTAVIDSTENK